MDKNLKKNVKDTLITLLETVAVIDPVTGIPWGLPDEDVKRFANIGTPLISDLASKTLDKNNKVWSDLVADLIDEGDCDLDHHGYCQAHDWMQKGICPHFRAKLLLEKLSKEKVNNG